MYITIYAFLLNKFFFLNKMWCFIFCYIYISSSSATLSVLLNRIKSYFVVDNYVFSLDYNWSLEILDHKLSWILLAEKQNKNMLVSNKPTRFALAEAQHICPLLHWMQIHMNISRHFEEKHFQIDVCIKFYAKLLSQ